MKCSQCIFVFCCVACIFLGEVHAQERGEKVVSERKAESDCPCVGEAAAVPELATKDVTSIPVQLGPLLSVTLLKQTSSSGSHSLVDGVMIDFVVPVVSDLPFGIGERLDAFKHNGCWVKITQNVDVDGDGTVDNVLEAWRFATPCPLRRVQR